MYSPRVVGGGALPGALAVTGSTMAPMTTLVVIGTVAVLIGVFCLWRTARLRRQGSDVGPDSAQP